MMANIGHAGAGLVWITFALITMGSCATYEPVSLNEVPFRDRAVTLVDNDVRVSAVVLSEDETELIFAADLYARGIQPIWLEIENNEEFTVRFLAAGLDPEYFAPLEASYISRFRWAKYANEQKDEHYLSMALGEHIQAGTTRSGFVFSHLEHGTRVFNVDIIGKDHDLRTFSFTTQVPGLETDYREIDWAKLYPSDQIVDHDLDSLRAALLGLPCCVTSQDGGGQGHPLNIVFVGSFQDILYALVRSGWDETGVTTKPHGKSKPIQGVDDRYRPVSIRYVYGRRQDASFRKSRHSVNPRTHLRLWMSPMTWEGIQVWVAQVGRDFEVEPKSSTHATDADDARSYLMQGVMYAQRLEKWGYVPRLDGDLSPALRSSFTDVTYYADGYRMVMFVSSDPVAIDEVDDLGLVIPAWE
jgi:hypothetical protein